MTKVARAAFETMQFFEVDIPEGTTVEEYMETDDFRKACADLITSSFIDFQIERRYDADGNEI